MPTSGAARSASSGLLFFGNADRVDAAAQPVWRHDPSAVLTIARKSKKPRRISSRLSD
jgi:hypothetical protein